MASPVIRIHLNPFNHKNHLAHLPGEYLPPDLKVGDHVTVIDTAPDTPQAYTAVIREATDGRFGRRYLAHLTPTTITPDT